MGSSTGDLMGRGSFGASPHYKGRPPAVGVPGASPEASAGAKLGPGPRPARRGGAYKPQGMDCPKCGHQQTDTVKCTSCGIYFAKFAQQQAWIASRSGAPSHETP